MRIKRHLILVSLILIGSLSVGASYVGTRYAGLAVPIKGASIERQNAGQVRGKAIIDLDKVLTHHPMWPRIKGIDEKIRINRKLLAEAMKSESADGDLRLGGYPAEPLGGDSASAFSTYKRILETEKIKKTLEEELEQEISNKRVELAKEADLRTQKFAEQKESEFLTYKRQVEETYPRNIVNIRLKSMVRAKGSAAEGDAGSPGADDLNNKILSLIGAKRAETDESIDSFKKEQNEYVETQMNAYRQERRAVLESSLKDFGGTGDYSDYRSGQAYKAPAAAKTDAAPMGSGQVRGSADTGIYYDKERELTRRRKELKAELVSDISDVFIKYCADHSLKAVHKMEPGAEYIDVTDKVIRLL